MLSPEQREVVEYALSCGGGTVNSFCNGYDRKTRTRKAGLELIRRTAKALGIEIMRPPHNVGIFEVVMEADYVRGDTLLKNIYQMAVERMCK